MQMVDKLAHAAVHRGIEADVVDHDEMGDEFAQPDAARMRTHGHAESAGHRHDREVVVHAADSARIKLADLHGARRKELLEHHAVLALFARRHPNRLNRAGDLGVTEHIVRRHRLLEPPDVEGCERLDPLDRLLHIEALVGVDHERALWPDFLANNARAAHIVVDRLADLHLEVREAIGERFAAARADDFIGIADPSATGGVGGEALALDAGDALGAGRVVGAQHLKAAGFVDGVADSVEVHRGDEFFGGHFREHLPQRLANNARLEVPHRVDDRRKRKRHHALLGTEPTELRILRERAPETATVVRDLSDALTHHHRHERFDRLADDLVAAADGEGEAVTFVRARVCAIRLEDHIRRRVVGIDVHSVGAMRLLAGGKAEVDDLKAGDGGGAHRCFVVFQRGSSGTHSPAAALL